MTLTARLCHGLASLTELILVRFAKLNTSTSSI